jgi:hypothetical protein
MSRRHLFSNLCRTLANLGFFGCQEDNKAKAEGGGGGHHGYMVIE